MRRRSAAGGAGGRPAVPGSGRPPRRTTAAATLAGLLVVPTVALAPPAAAATEEPAPAADEQPVDVELTRLDPRTLSPGATVTVAGTLTNTGTETLTDLDLRLQRGAPVTTRGELQAGDGDPDPMTAAATPFQDAAAELRPGDSAPFTLTTTTDALAVTGDGVYPVLLNLNGVGRDGERRRVGELATQLVQPPLLPAVPTGVAWLWPLVERTHRAPSGAFLDDGLAREVAADGRLDRVLATLEQLPRTAPAEGGEPVPVVPVTLAVDPALVEGLAVMADGPYAVAGEAGSGTEEAAAFLDRLRAVAAVHPVVALPYGDVDADALTATGLPEVLARSLPGSPGGTAQDGAGAPTGPATGLAGVAVLREVLGVEPRTDLAWAVGGSLRPETLGVLADGGVEEVVLSPAGLTDGSAGLGLSGPAAARTTVPTADGAVEALVADPVLSDVTGVPGGPRAVEQRHLAELALLTLQPGGAAAGQSVLVAPPREVDPDPAAVSAAMALSAQLPGLRPATVAELGDGPVAVTGELVPPPGPGGLEPAGLADVAAAVAVRDQLAGAVVGDAASALAPWDAAIARTTSSAWRDEPAAFVEAAGDLRAAMGRLLERVTLLSPADGTYSLASSDAPLVLTVRNDLPFALRVQLRLETRGNALAVGDLGDQVLEPEERTTLQVPAEVRQPGRFGVVATLTTPDGAPLGDPVQLQVQSTAYGTISVVITLCAAGLLALLFLRRLVRFVLRRRRGGADGDGDLPGGPAPDGAAVPLPPTRSPV